MNELLRVIIIFSLLITLSVSIVEILEMSKAKGEYKNYDKGTYNVYYNLYNEFIIEYVLIFFACITQTIFIITNVLELIKNSENKMYGVLNEKYKKSRRNNF